MRVGSLFSGIGGIDLGLKRTGEFRTIWFSEINDYCSKILEKHWKGVPNYGDITKIEWEKVELPDVLVGGFPCQDISVAGKGAGIKEGTRSGLWKEYSKAIGILRPKYVLIENVPMLVKRGLDIVLADLAKNRYDAFWFNLSAQEVGALHKRERIFVIAYPSSFGCICGGDNRERRQILQIKERALEENQQERNRRQFGTYTNVETDIANTWGERIQRLIAEKTRGFPEFSWCENIGRVEDLRNRPDIPEPLVCRGSDGIPFRMDRTKAIGNAVVPACAQICGEIIMEIEKLKCRVCGAEETKQETCELLEVIKLNRDNKGVKL